MTAPFSAAPSAPLGRADDGTVLPHTVPSPSPQFTAPSRRLEHGIVTTPSGGDGERHINLNIGNFKIGRNV